MCSRPNQATTITSNTAALEELEDTEVPEPVQSSTHAAASHPRQSSLCAIVQVPIAGTSQDCCVFLDGGSDSTYVTFKCADRLQLKPVRKIHLEVTTMGNIVTTIPSTLFEMHLRTVSGRIAKIEAFGMKEITGLVSLLNLDVVGRLFPEIDPVTLQRKASTVDCLIGCDYFGLHPKHEIAKAGENLSVMSGELGIILQGSHIDFVDKTTKRTHCARIVHGSSVRTNSFFVSKNSHILYERPLQEM